MKHPPTTEVEKDLQERLERALIALTNMYFQYCGDGHSFMRAGEYASHVLEEENVYSFDDAGRPKLNPHAK